MTERAQEAEVFPLGVPGESEEPDGAGCAGGGGEDIAPVAFGTPAEGPSAEALEMLVGGGGGVDGRGLVEGGCVAGGGR